MAARSFARESILIAFHAAENSTGAEPSVSVAARALTEAMAAVDSAIEAALSAQAAPAPQYGLTPISELVEDDDGTVREAAPAMLVASDEIPPWKLISPDGRQWTGGTAIECAGKEMRERVPADVAIARIWAAVDEAEEELRSPLEKRVIDLHDKASMPWAQAYELALEEAGFDEDSLRELIGECGDMGDFISGRESIEEFARAVLVWGPAYLPRSALATPAARGDAEDAARYREVRRGQHWNVVDGIGDHLRADELDARLDAARAARSTGAQS
jgi:hypothetical protein